MYDITLANVHLVDPVNNVDKICSIVVDHDKIVDITDQPSGDASKKIVDFSGKVAVPGIIDIHTHITELGGGSEGGFYMLAKAGVCTALDLEGPIRDAFPSLWRYGSGINIAVLESLRPGENLSSSSPGSGELRDFIATSMESGAIGCKLLGGHYPLTPEASHEFVRLSHEEKAYAAWHAGTTSNVNTIHSFQDMMELADGHPLHAAHINTYCRGLVKDELIECSEAFKLLEKHRNVYSDSYLAQTNGTELMLDETGRPRSHATCLTLRRAHYEESREGLIKAMRDGYGHVFAPMGMETGIYNGEEAVRIMIEKDFNVNGGFNVNPALSRLYCCLAKNRAGDFIIDALGTDGGAIPRNVIVSHGIALVNMGMLSLSDFVKKTSVMPARMLGLPSKGHLGIGADADITILDLGSCRPVMTMVGGRICMHEGVITGSGGSIITTERGRRTASTYGLPLIIVDENDFLPERSHHL